MNLRKIIPLFVLATLLFGTGCRRRSVSPKRYMRRDIDNSELVGTWRVTDSTLKILENEGYRQYINEKDHQLILRNDMTCEISCFFHMLFYPTPQQEREDYIHKKEGIWKIIKTAKFAGQSKDFQAVEIEIGEQNKTVNEIYINTTTLKFFLAEMGNKVIMWNYIGDPDYTEFFDFVKENG